MPGSGDASTQVNVLANVSLGAEVGCASVESHADADRSGGQPSLCFGGGGKRP